jgi:hypothetical protein
MENESGGEKNGVMEYWNIGVMVENPVLYHSSFSQAAQKDPEARRATNRRAEAYIGSTLTR